MSNNEYIGTYQILGEAGRGAMAKVMHAWSPELNCEVAIKEPLISEFLDPKVRNELANRFVKEAEVGSRLNHPNIVSVYAADVFNGRPAIVMEYVKGRTLDAYLGNGPLGADIVVNVMSQLLDAIGYAHSMGIVHRDIKPENIFVLPGWYVKLSDFGIASYADNRPALTQHGAVVGTPGYMSPEQARGQKVDSRADIFSLGVLAYELLTGRNPFGFSSNIDPSEMLRRVVQEPAPAIPHSIIASTPSHVINAILRALEKDPNNRPQTAEDFKRMLNEPSVAAVSVDDPKKALVDEATSNASSFGKRFMESLGVKSAEDRAKSDPFANPVPQPIQNNSLNDFGMEPSNEKKGGFMSGGLPYILLAVVVIGFMLLLAAN